MAKCYAIAGGMFGDEGKGRVSQFFTQRCIDDYGGAVCIRSVGGANAGHTVYVNGKKFKTHILPVGAFYPNTVCVIGNGVFVDVELLLKELEIAKCKNYFISPSAHVVLPAYKALDALKEEKVSLGTTKRGISIAASQKFGYNGLRIADLADKQGEKRLRQFLKSFKDFLPENTIDVEANMNVLKCIEKLRYQLIAPHRIIQEYEDETSHGFVIEGAQGTMLDINHGYMYPFVSAGSFTFNGLMDGIGYHMDPTDKVLVLKTYNSLLSPVPMKSEIKNENFVKDAGEFGTTTGRPRRVGWLDLELVSYSSKMNRPSSIFLTRLDTLNWFPTNGLSYRLYYGTHSKYRFDNMAVRDGRITASGERFIKAIEEAADAPVRWVGIGPKEGDIICR